MKRLTEIHGHFLYGLDDGAKDRAQMEELLDMAAAQDIRVLYATPHLIPGVKQLNEQLLAARLAEARSYVSRLGYDMRLLSGAEVMWTPLCFHLAADRCLPALEGTNRVLVEFPPDIAFSDLLSAVQTLLRAGCIPVIAHAERCRCLRLGRAKKLTHTTDAELQVNCGSVFMAKYLRRHRVRRMIKHGLITYVASDAHNPVTRPFRMRRAYEWLERHVGVEVAERLCGGID